MERHRSALDRTDDHAALVDIAGKQIALHALDADERAQLAQDGYVVREGVFSAADCAAIAADCEALIRDLEAARRNDKQRVGSYMFEANAEIATVVASIAAFAPTLRARRQVAPA